MPEAWDDALWALRALCVDPAGIGGIWVRAGHGPVRDTWLSRLQACGLPVTKVPSHADDQALLGGIDLTQSLQERRLSWKPGLLAQAHQGVVMIPMAERAPRNLLALLTQTMDQGQVRSEQGHPLPSLFGVVALDESDPDEVPVHESLTDRLGLWIDLRGLSMHEIDAGEPPSSADSPLVTPDALLHLAVSAVSPVSAAQVEALCHVAHALGIDSTRAILQALRVARIHAACAGRVVVEEPDLIRATRCVLLPRAKRLPVDPQETAESSAPQEPQPSESPPPESSQDAAPPPSPESVEALEEVILAAAVASLPDHLLDSLLSAPNTASKGAAVGQSGHLQKHRLRGRPLPSRPGRPHDQARLDLLATLKHAAPRQRLRRAALPGSQVALQLRAEDFHTRRFEQASASCLILALDASGSAAMHRLAQAKGAVELLLAQSYSRRDRVCVIAFRGTQAQCLLPPTRSLVRAKRALAGVPGGGGTPLAHALRLCLEQALKLQREGSTPHLVVLSDGRANVSLQGMGGRTQAQADAQQLAVQWAMSQMDALWIDTAPQPEPLAQSLARAMTARYLPMPHVQAQRLASAMQVNDVSGSG